MSNVAISVLPPDEVRAGFDRLNVSRETLERCSIHLRLLAKWQPRINLVGPATLADAWRRHVLDSAQLFALLPPESREIVDLGSGAGFPGLILSFMGAESVHLVDSDARKAAFLREVARETGVGVTIHAKRAEAMPEMQADAVTARALAPLPELLQLAAKFLATRGVCLFPKGRTAENELTEAARSWTMRIERFDSVTDSAAAILRLSDIVKK